MSKKETKCERCEKRKATYKCEQCGRMVCWVCAKKEDYECRECGSCPPELLKISDWK